MAIVFAECLATCDLPAGAANVLTGQRIELAPHLARHMDVGALEAHALDAPFAAELARLAADNLKRARFVPALSPAEWFAAETQDLAHVAAFTELKTIWHPPASDDQAPGRPLRCVWRRPGGRKEAPVCAEADSNEPQGSRAAARRRAARGRRRPPRRSSRDRRAACGGHRREPRRRHDPAPRRGAPQTPPLVAALERWWLDPRTQAFIAELNAAGL